MLTGPPLAPPRCSTIPEALALAARSQVGLAFVDGRERETPLSYADLHARALRAAHSLLERGIRRGDRIALVLPTGPGFMDAFFGALCAGAVPVPLYPPVRLGRLDEFHARTARMLQVSGARLVLTDSRVGRLLGVAVLRARPELGTLDVGELVPRGAPVGVGLSPDDPAPPCGPDDLALLQFSSGTTVDPKPVALTHRAILANVAAIDSFLPAGSAATHSGVSWLPLYHDMGLIGSLLTAVYHPGSLALIPPELFLARPALWLRTISRRRAAVSVAPNFAFGLCLRRVRDEELAGVDLSCWQLALNGAEPISPAVLRRFAERFGPFGFDPRALLPVYGLSEAALAVTFSAPGEALTSHSFQGRELASVGRPVPGFSVKAVDGAGREVADGEVGRILARGPSLLREYFGDPAATAQVLRDGWLDTGDLGFVRGGALFVSGRAKDVIILRGANHAPQEFEEALAELPGVRPGCSAAIGCLPRELQPSADPLPEGEELVLLVELDGGAAVPASLAEEIAVRVVERTGIRPYSVELLAPGTLPRTSSGKLRRLEARRQYVAGELTAPKAVTPLGLAGEVAKSYLAFARGRLPG